MALPIRGEILRIERLSKAFPGVQALDGVSLCVRAGEIHALVGENGAGKSTLMKILAGIHPKDAGTIELDGVRVDPRTPREAQRIGISTVHQELSLAPNLTVAENIFVRREPTVCGLIRWGELRREAHELLGPFGVRLSPTARVGTLNVAMQQIVEIVRALSFQPKILMLDEPTSSLEAHEVDRLLGLLRDLVARGIGILYVTHKLKEVFRAGDTVTVLRDGRVIATKPVAGTTEDEVVRMMVGRELTQMYPEKAGHRGEPLLRVEGLRLTGLFGDISFTLHAGEILGMAGLVGAGRTEVAQTIFGYRLKDGGRIFLATGEGEAAAEPPRVATPRETRIDSPTAAVQHGLAYLPEDRKAAGMFLKMGVLDNVIAANLRGCSRGGLIRERLASETVAAWVDRFHIRTPFLRQRVGLLSGGNQQKVLLARWLETRPRVLIADEPTRGIDVGAKAEIHALLRQLANQGLGILLISSELPEILGMCDRVLVLHEGQLAGELGPSELSEEAIMRLATGHAR